MMVFIAIDAKHVQHVFPFSYGGFQMFTLISGQVFFIDVPT
jgi:hypothetical protein